MNNEKAYEYLTNAMVMTRPDHKAMQEMGQFYYDKMCFLAECIKSSIAKKRSYDRLELTSKFSESYDFLNRITGKVYFRCTGNEKTHLNVKVTESGSQVVFLFHSIDFYIKNAYNVFELKFSAQRVNHPC